MYEVRSEVDLDRSTVRLQAPEGAREGQLLCTRAGGVLSLCAVPEGASTGDLMLFSTPSSSAGAGAASDGDDGGDDEDCRLVDIQLPPDAKPGERLLGRLPNGDFVAFKVPAVIPRRRRIRVRAGPSQ